MSSRICCTSVYHAVKCRNNSKFARNHAFSVGEQCLSQPPDRGVFRPAAVIAESIREKESYDPIFSVFSVFLITLIGATAFTGLSSFSVVISIFYIATTIAILIFTVGVIFGIGNISLGLRYFIRISELYKLFQLKMLVDLTFMCFSMVALKFFILSIACYLHRSFNPYTWSTIIYLKRAFVDVLFLMVNLSILGRFEEEGHRSSVSILTDVKQYARVIPEFFGTFDNFGFFFYLYYIVAALMNFGQLAGPFFVCYTLAKDHFPMKSQKVENIGIFFLTFCHFLISLIGDSRHEAMYGRNLIQSYWGSCFLVMAIFAIVFLYGPLELELDRVRIVKPTMSKKQEYLDKLSTYRIDLLRVVITPLLTLILVIGTIYVFAHAAQPPEGKNKMIHAIDIVMLCFPITYFFFYQIMLHRKRTKHNINLKKLLLPTKNHPSYSRIMLGEPNTNEYQKTLMPQRSFTRV